MTDKKTPEGHTVTITDNVTGKRLDCAVIKGTDGPPVIDVRQLYSTLGLFALDPGFVSTASCRSAITYLDGEAGVLLHRGYPIDQLAQKSSYMELCYLLIYGELPTQAQLDAYVQSIGQHSNLHTHLERLHIGYRYDAHPMAMMASLTSSLSSYYYEDLDIKNPEHRDIAAKRVLAKMPIMAAQCYKHGIGQHFVPIRSDMNYIENFLHMMFAAPHLDYEPSPTAVRALELMFILHADHEQNASTSTVRLAGSSESNPFACIAAGIITLWGKAHGGANEAVIRMLDSIEKPENIEDCLKRAKDKSDPFRLMGFGHRVYKNHDPRATIIRSACHDLLRESGAVNQPMFEIAMRLEEIALKDEYFIERSLYPNVDFYSGIILQALNIPKSMFTVLFAVARSAGWIAQWLEMMQDPDFRIGRPRQLYTGAAPRTYMPISKR